MKFVLIDRISEFETGRRIVAHKALSLAEEYLGDHFPAFPVLPGVLQLEAMVQASAWVVREALEFAPSIVLLKEARNVTCKELNAEQSVFVAGGTVDGREIVKGKLTLRHLNLADGSPHLAEADERIRTHLRALFDLTWVKRPAGAGIG